MTVSDARALDLLETLDDLGGAVGLRPRRNFGLQARQVEGGTSVTVRALDGRLALVVGLYADELGRAEAWFAAGPALGEVLLPSLRAARHVLEFVGREASPLEVIAYIHPRSVAGGRLAAWFGFKAAGVANSPLGVVQTWTRRFP